MRACPRTTHRSTCRSGSQLPSVAGCRPAPTAAPFPPLGSRCFGSASVLPQPAGPRHVRSSACSRSCRACSRELTAPLMRCHICAPQVLWRAPAAPKCLHSRPFRIASVTKTFTSAATRRLAEEELLHPGDPVVLHLLRGTTAVLGERGHGPDSITVLQLLAHTSGSPDQDSPEYQQAVLVDLGKRWTRAEQLRFALGRFFMAGASSHNFECSVTGHNLLGEIIRNKIRMHPGAASRSLLKFDAIGLSSTWMEAFEPAPPALAAFAHAYCAKGLDLRAVKSTVDSHRGVAWCRRSATSLASFEQC